MIGYNYSLLFDPYSYPINEDPLHFLSNSNSEINWAESQSHLSPLMQNNRLAYFSPPNYDDFCLDSKFSDNPDKRKKNAESSKISRDKKRKQEVIDYSILMSQCNHRKHLKKEIVASTSSQNKQMYNNNLL
ncbi:hypothetical protein HZS_7510 [Henneguya salminicola]|nr:hypothetical protein HZS_7510 [Henneguya salminicola]